MNIERVTIRDSRALHTINLPLDPIQLGIYKGAIVRVVCNEQPTEQEMKQLFNVGVYAVKVVVQNKEQMLVPTETVSTQQDVRSAVEQSLGDTPPTGLKEYVTKVMNEVGV